MLSVSLLHFFRVFEYVYELKNVYELKMLTNVYELKMLKMQFC